ncbi:EAL domain-containing protein [Thalassotalea piscium]
MISTKIKLIKVIQFGFIVVSALVVLALCLLLALNQFILPNFILSIAIVLVMVLLCLALFRFKKALLNAINTSFEPIQTLEVWGEQNQKETTISPLSDNTPVGITIANLQKQLLIESHGNSSFDMLLREKALLDSETGIGNREFFSNRLEALLKEEDAHGAVLFLHFKECEIVQSLYGKQQALALLVTLIHTIQHRLSHLPSFFIARRNEFELALLIPAIYVKDTEKLATRLINNLMTVPLPVGISNDEFIHIGISFFRYGAKSYQVMSEADMALRSAQLQGPSQWFMYDKNEVEQAKGSLKWRTLLTKAITKKSFVIFLQPVVGQDTNTILHHEVVIKIQEQKTKWINDRVFMPMVRKCGFTQQVDLLIFKQVCQLLTDNKTQGLCSLNLSIESLMSTEFIEEIKGVLLAYPDIAKKIIIEISEYHLVNHLTQLTPILFTLNEQGMMIFADKVGQYVVSSKYLKTCPISAIKLHLSIVLDIHHKPENQTVIQSLKGICEPLNINIYALGVDCQEEWQTLKQLGVSGGQGLFFTKQEGSEAKATHLH